MKHLNHQDLNQNELQNAVIQRLNSHPGSPVEGQIHYYNTDDSLYIEKAAGTTKLLDATDIQDDDTFASPSATKAPSSESVKEYINSRITGLQWLSVRVASTANVNISNGLENGDTLDGETLATGDHVLLKDQDTASQNGIYVVPASGAAARASYTGADLANKAIIVNEGTTNESTGWIIANDAITLDTTELTIVEFGATSAVPQATTDTQGKVELATVAETKAKTDTERAVTPSGLADFPRKYAADISASTGATITAATHGLGATKNLIVQIYEDGSPNVMIGVDISVADNGDVTYASNTAFSGHIVIIG